MLPAPRLRLVFLCESQCSNEEHQKIHRCNPDLNVSTVWSTRSDYAVWVVWRPTSNLLKTEVLVGIRLHFVSSMEMPADIADVRTRVAQNEMDVWLFDGRIRSYRVELSAIQEVEALLSAVEAAPESQVQRLLTTLGDGRLERRVFSWLR